MTDNAVNISFVCLLHNEQILKIYFFFVLATNIRGEILKIFEVFNVGDLAVPNVFHISVQMILVVLFYTRFNVDFPLL